MFQGTRQLVTVPEASRVEESIFGCNPRRRYSGANMRPGTTREMYCSGMVILDKRQVNSVATTRPVTERMPCTTVLTIISICPVSSAMPPNIMAIRVRDTDCIMFMRPPAVKSLSKLSMPV